MNPAFQNAGMPIPAKVFEKVFRVRRIMGLESCAGAPIFVGT